jgi:hypothetical protein
MAHVHQLDVCRDDQWYPHHFRFLNGLTTHVTVAPVAGYPFPFVADPNSNSIDVPPGGCDVKFIPNIPPASYKYDVIGCGTRVKSPKTVIIS